MSKKLLSEAQVRRFQALATIKPLVEMDSSYKMEEMAYKKDDQNESLYEEEEEAEEMEMDADADMDEADVEMDEELVQKFMDAASTIQQVADTLGGEAGDMDDADEMDMGAEEPADDMDMGGEEPPAPEAEEGGEEEEEMLEEALRGISYVPSQKEIIKTVAKRVAKRLQEAKNAQAKLNKALGKRR